MAALLRPSELASAARLLSEQLCAGSGPATAISRLPVFSPSPPAARNYPDLLLQGNSQYLHFAIPLNAYATFWRYECNIFINAFIPESNFRYSPKDTGNAEATVRCSKIPLWS